MARPIGMRAFTVVWLGQVVSLVGTGMTQFGITIWAWELTHEATALALMTLLAFGPTVLLSPFAGVLVDRWDRKRVMILTDLSAGLTTIALLLLYVAGALQLWHLYAAALITGSFQSLQFPAYSAAISTMLPKEQYGRAAGMMTLADAGSGILAPIFAGALLGVIGLAGIMLIDVITFVFAISALLFVMIPPPVISEAGRASRGSLLQEAAFGFRYIYARRSLFSLQMVFFFTNLIASFGQVLLAPMILARSGDNEQVLGTVMSTGAVGGVVGGVLLSLWGGPKRKVHGVLIGMLLVSLFGEIPMGLGRSVLAWSAAFFVSYAVVPILNGSNQAIWQAKVPPDIQGRVFATRRLIAQVAFPLGAALAGPLADRVFEPGMMPDGAMARAFGGLVGTGPGAGMALMFVIAGVLSALVALGGYLFPAVRDVETVLPDHSQPVAEEAPTAGTGEEAGAPAS